jgi:exopolysaccharide biosynthesis protein
VRATLIVAEVDPTRTALALDIAREGDTMGPWTIDRAPADAQIAFNAGQFADAGPWGWVIHRGREWQPPGLGTLSAAVVVDSTGRVRVLGSGQIAAARARGGWVEALQSYPVLLDRGQAPRALCAPGTVDRAHRDIRLALGVRPDGRVLVVLSRYAGAGPAGTRLPIGPTTLEMAEIMRRLGAAQAVMLDGGLSAQLLVRDDAGTHRWAGLRAVPLALVGRPVSLLAPGSGTR